MFCQNCGNPILEKARFCGNCGAAAAPLSEPAQPSGVPAPPPFAPASAVAPVSYAPPAPPQSVPQGLAAGPVPPNLPWPVVLILSWVTFGLGALVWGFKQALFVKKIDPSSKAVLMLVLAVISMVVQVCLAFVGTRSYGSSREIMTALSALLNLPILVAGLIAIFGMRSALIRYYNTVEPIGLRLNGVMTFFFSILYFQYHFSRIARWKKTGTLS